MVVVYENLQARLRLLYSRVRLCNIFSFTHTLEITILGADQGIDERGEQYVNNYGGMPPKNFGVFVL